MKKTLIITLILALLVAGGWWLLARAHDPRHDNMVEFETDMTAGLLRGIMQEFDTDKPRFYFVAFGETRTDPSRLFIARFAKHFPPVRGITSSVTTRNGQVLETASGRAGVIIQIIRFKKAIPGTFDVLVLFPNQPAGENRFIYRISNNSGEWVIQRRLPALVAG